MENSQDHRYRGGVYIEVIINIYEIKIKCFSASFSLFDVTPLILIFSLTGYKKHILVPTWQAPDHIFAKVYILFSIKYWFKMVTKITDGQYKNLTSQDDLFIGSYNTFDNICRIAVILNINIKSKNVCRWD